MIKVILGVDASERKVRSVLAASYIVGWDGLIYIKYYRLSKTMNYCYNYSPVPTFYAQPEDAANYFNSLAPMENYFLDSSSAFYYQTIPYSYPCYTTYSYCKASVEAERSTSDSDE